VTILILLGFLLVSALLNCWLFLAKLAAEAQSEWFERQWRGDA
jgi:hypothetical protein